jgi:hypothetical protein
MSEVKVNKISPRTDCGTTTLGDSGDSITVAGDLKSNSLKATDGGSIISQSGTTITIGASGDTVSLASGASQSGFGRSGSVDWQTGSIKTATFTAASGEGYFCNTSGGVLTVNLPAGSAGAIVAVADYTRSFNTNNLTITPNGSDKIAGTNDSLTLDVNGQALTLVYVDGTEGWINVQNAEDTEEPSSFICASVSGACNTLVTAPDCANTKIATFKGPGTFTVNSISSTPANNEISYLIVAGGGGGAYEGAGGAGGYREVKTPLTPYTASPICGYGTPGNRVSVTAQGYPIVVGGGGAGITQNAPTLTPGSVSSGFGIPSAGGGGGGNSGTGGAANGGSGGGGRSSSPTAGGSGNTPPVTPAQGNNGGSFIPAGNPAASRNVGGGGGGATARGGGLPDTDSGYGGAGAGTQINTAVGVPGPSGPLRYFAGGGGGGIDTPAPAQAGGAGGGGAGQGGNACNGTANTGGGGGGSWNNTGGSGGSGIVVIRYKFQ